MFCVEEEEYCCTHLMELEMHAIELKTFRENADAGLIEIVDKIENSLDIWKTFLSRNDVLKADTLLKKLIILSSKKL